MIKRAILLLICAMPLSMASAKKNKAEEVRYGAQASMALLTDGCGAKPCLWHF